MRKSFSCSLYADADAAIPSVGRWSVLVYEDPALSEKQTSATVSSIASTLSFVLLHVCVSMYVCCAMQKTSTWDFK